MPVSVVVGGQYGGEGKGAVNAFLSETGRYSALVKTGGPNAWHNYGKAGVMHDVRMFPSGATLRPIEVIFPPGALIHVPTFFAEREKYQIQGPIIIDPLAGVIDETHVAAQKADPFYAEAGSALRGTGTATAARSKRRLRLAREEPSLARWIGSTANKLEEHMAHGRQVLVEGGQGFGLSNFHGDYPFATSRDTTAPSFLSQTGLGAGYLGEVFLTIKCLPTRNPAGKGVLRNEIVAKLDHAAENALSEHGGTPSADGRTKRRVGLFDFDLLRKATLANTPTAIALTGFDRLSAVLHLPIFSDHYGSLEAFRTRVSTVSNAPIALEGWGPCIEDMRITEAGRTFLS